MEIKQSVINKIAGMTDRNLHCEALIMLASLLDAEEEKAHLERILRQQLRQGFLYGHQDGERYTIYRGLMEKAKMILSKENYDALYMAF